ncbi:hypothetical protein MVEG_08530 [Podila verticillata NRRL 6337]|nr:hypothetical protein MVEG_08530 [Podila verticillata NRRL 6337]
MVADGSIHTLGATQYSGSVTVISHNGADRTASDERRPKLDELYEIEQENLSLAHLRIIFNLRQYAKMTDDQATLRLPMDLQLLNPIATVSVIRTVLNIITNRPTGSVANHLWWITHITGTSSFAKSQTGGRAHWFLFSTKTRNYSCSLVPFNNLSEAM